MSAILNFDASQIAPDTGSQDAVPAGWYDVFMEASEMKPTKDGTGAYLECKFNIVQPQQYAGKKVYARLNLRNANATAQEIGYKQLSAICHACKVLQVQDSGMLHNIPLKIKVKLRKAEGDYEASNDITAYKNINEVVGTPGAAAAQGAFAAPGAFMAPAAGFQPPPQAAAAQAWQPPAANPGFNMPQAAQAPMQQPAVQMQQAPAPQAQWQPPAGQQPWQAPVQQAAPQPQAQVQMQPQQMQPQAQMQPQPQWQQPAVQQQAAPAVQQQVQQQVAPDHAATAQVATPPWMQPQH